MLREPQKFFREFNKLLFGSLPCWSENLGREKSYLIVGLSCCLKSIEDHPSYQSRWVDCHSSWGPKHAWDEDGICQCNEWGHWVIETFNSRGNWITIYERRFPDGPGFKQTWSLPATELGKSPSSLGLNLLASERYCENWMTDTSNVLRAVSITLSAQ